MDKAGGIKEAGAKAANGERWSLAEEKSFERFLAESFDRKDRFEEIALRMPTKSVEQVRQHYLQLVEDVKNIEAGRVPLPNYPDNGNTSTSGSKKSGKAGGKDQPSDRKKGIPWTEEEHRLFLLGLEKFGKGDWRSISRNFVVSRTPTQVASHAQKYFIRLSSMNKRDKRRASIHDITSVDQADVQNMAASVHARQAENGLGPGQPGQANKQTGGIFGAGMASMPPASYVLPPQGGQQYV